MSRHGYVDGMDLDNWDMIRWRGQVASSIRGRRGQALLRDVLAELDAMPEKRLVRLELQDEGGDVCALGAAARMRGIDVAEVDPEDSPTVARTLDVAECLAREVAFVNDDYGPPGESPEERFTRVRAWVAEKIKGTATCPLKGKK